MFTIKLSKPIQAHGETVAELKLREPIAKDLRSLPIGGSTTVGDMIPVLSSIAGIPPSSVDQMVPADLFEALAYISPFFDRSPGPTGDPS